METPTGGDEQRHDLALRSAFLPAPQGQILGSCRFAKRMEEAADILVHPVLSSPQLLVTEWGVSHNFQVMPTLEQLNNSIVSMMNLLQLQPPPW